MKHTTSARQGRTALWLCLVLWAWPACAPEQVCGPGQMQSPAGYCVCAPGHVLEPSGKPYCVPIPMGAGLACSAASPCGTAPFTRCQPATMSGADGYCTSAGCATSADCPTGFACDRSSTPSYCRRPPTGQGKTCAATSDCAGQEAAFCDNRYLKQCLVDGCTVAPNSCHEGWTCCDLTSLGLAKTLCLPVSTCPGS